MVLCDIKDKQNTLKIGISSH